jgi:hypothetical protein
MSENPLGCSAVRIRVRNVEGGVGDLTHAGEALYVEGVMRGEWAEGQALRVQGRLVRHASIYSPSLSASCLARTSVKIIPPSPRMRPPQKARPAYLESVVCIDQPRRKSPTVNQTAYSSP